MITSNRAKVLLRAETSSAKINRPGAKGDSNNHILKPNIILCEKRKYFVMIYKTLTSRAHSVGVFIFSTEDGLLHHAEEYDPCYPELDP